MGGKEVIENLNGKKGVGKLWLKLYQSQKLKHTFQSV